MQQAFREQDAQFWLLQAVFWLGWGSIHLIIRLYYGIEAYSLVIIVLDMIVAVIVTTGLRYIYQMIWERPLLVRAVGVLVASMVGGMVWNVFKRHVELMSGDPEYQVMFDEFGFLGYYTFQWLGLSFYIVLAWSAIYFGLTFYGLLQEERRKSLNAQAMAHEAQLRMLRYQLNPHFLFNTLNAISTLILDKDTELANGMVSKLSTFLRYSLDKDPMQKVDLEHEVNTMKLYLEIEQVRFGDRLKVEFDIDETAARALVPSMLLQPLVENSIKYAVAKRENGGTIKIHAKVFAGDLLLEVFDDGPGIAMEEGKLPEFTGVGLRNTRDRLAELYGSAHSCRISEALPHGLKIDIRIPFEKER